MTVTSIVKKAHTLYVSMKREILREVHWKRGDKLIAVVVDGDVVLRKLRSDELADAVRGAMVRRRDATRKEKVDGIWDNPRQPKAGE